MDINILNSFLFHPRMASQQIGANDHLIEVEEGIKVGVRFHLINTSAPNVLFFHGNGEIGPEYDDIAAVYNQRGFNFIIADFRGYGFSSGTPTAKNTQSDAHIVLDYILSYLQENSYKGALCLMGRSLGSVSALELAGRYPKDFSGLIIESGFATEKPLLQIFNINPLDINYNESDGFENLKKLKSYSKPLFVIHADLDHIIPIQEARIIEKEAASSKKELWVIENANHNDILMHTNREYFSRIERFINSI